MSRFCWSIASKIFMKGSLIMGVYENQQYPEAYRNRGPIMDKNGMLWPSFVTFSRRIERGDLNSDNKDNKGNKDSKDSNESKKR